MKNKLYSNELDEWEKLSLKEQIDCLINHLCRGPCGQSSSATQIRSRIEKTLNGCKKTLPEIKAVELDFVLMDDSYSECKPKYHYKVLDKKYEKERILACSEGEHIEMQKLQIKKGDSFRLIKSGSTCIVQKH